MGDGAQANVTGSTFELGSYAGINVTTTLPGASTLATISRSVVSKSNVGILGEVFANSSAVRIYVHDSVMEYNNDAGVAAYVSGSSSVADVTLGSSMVVVSNYCVRARSVPARAPG